MGDRVVVESSTSSILAAAAIVYVIPLVLFFAFYAAAALLHAAETVSVLSALAGFGIGIAVAMAAKTVHLKTRPSPFRDRRSPGDLNWSETKRYDQQYDRLRQRRRRGRRAENLRGAKSVNNRYLDVSVRLPRNFLFAEEGVKAQVARHISRGKVDVFVSVDASGADDVVISVNEELAGL